MAMSKKCDRCGKFYDHYPEKIYLGLIMRLVGCVLINLEVLGVMVTS